MSGKKTKIAVAVMAMCALTSSLLASAATCDVKKVDKEKAEKLVGIYLKGRIPSDSSVKIVGVSPLSPIKGFCEIDYAVYRNGKQVSATIPAFFDGERLLVGDVITEKGSYVDKRAVALNADRMERIKKDLVKKAQERKRKLSPILKKSAKKAVNGEWKEASIFIEGKNPNGKIYVIYTDPQCPYCVKMENRVLPGLLEKAKGVVIVDFPLSFHKQAELRSWYRHYAVYEKGEDPLKAIRDASSLPYGEIKNRLKKWGAEKPSDKWKKTVERVKKESGVRFTPTISTTEDGLLYASEILKK